MLNFAGEMRQRLLPDTHYNIYIAMAKLKLLVLALAAVLMAACGGSSAQEKAEELLRQADFDFEHGRYDMALASIDSLRKIYPNAVEVRRRALTLYQNISLKQAQEDLEQTDRLLQVARRDYDYIRQEVEKRRSDLKATPEQLRTMTLTKMKLDSLQVRFDMQCAKIKYIHKRQKEER